jgi:hypothetical protein
MSNPSVENSRGQPSSGESGRGVGMHGAPVEHGCSVV